MNVCAYAHTVDKRKGVRNIRKVRQIMKAFSDDTRLRIANLLGEDELTVSEICRILNRNQSLVSKHLAKMRLIGILGDRRKGFNVYYRLIEPKDKIYEKLIKAVSTCVSESKIGKEDLKNLKKAKKRRVSII